MDNAIRYRVQIDDPLGNRHAGILMFHRLGCTFGSPNPLVSAVLLRTPTIRGDRWRVVLASHTHLAAEDVHSGLVVAGRRAVILPMSPVPADPMLPPPRDASGNLRRLDMARAACLAEAGRVGDARELLSRHGLTHAVLEINVTSKVGK